MESKDLTHACFLSTAICDSVYNYTIGDNPITVEYVKATNPWFTPAIPALASF